MCRGCKLKGNANPNYGNKWSDTMKNIQSNVIKSKVDETYRLNCAKGMKGKMLSADSLLKRKKTNEEKLLDGYTRPNHTYEAKIIIGIKSKQKFTPEFLLNQRKTNEQNGNWIPLNMKDDYIFYRELSNWKTDVITKNMIGIDLLKKHQFKSKINNHADSIVRDHMFGRKAGYANGVFPELIRHPANCQLITHSNNVKKAKYNNDCIISLDELINKIINWDIEYIEHIICLELIEQYKMGLRYNKQNYINNYYE
jgi:hypothetical protein